MSKNPIPGIANFRIEKLSNSKVKSCFECRERKKKCSREVPSCSYCLNHHAKCIYKSNDKTTSEKHARLLLDPKCSNTQENKNNILNLKTIDSDITLQSINETRTNEIDNKISSETKKNDDTDDTNKNVHLKNRKIKNSIDYINNNIEDMKENHRKTSNNIKNITNNFDNSSKYDNNSKLYISSLKQSEKKHLTTESKQSLYSLKKEKIESLRKQTDNMKRLGVKTMDSSCKGAGLKKLHNFLPNDPNTFNRPELRVGSVFTKILNSSLNLQDKGLSVDLDLLNTFIPNRLESDILMDRYRSSVHPIIPIFDWQSIFPLYENFWNDQEIVDLSFYIVLFTIFYASSVSLYEENCIDSKTTLNKDILIKNMKYFVGATEIALSMDNFPHNISLVSLQSATVLYTIVRNDCRTDDYISISSLVRYSQLLELNRDPLAYHNLKNAREIQARRLLWWQIFYLDCTTALSTRLSPLIQQGEYDTQLPNEFKQYFNGQYKLDQSITFSNGRFRWIECCNKIVKASFNVKPLTEQELLRLTRDIENLSFCCSSLIQRMLDPINIMPSEEPFVKFASSVLSTFPDRCYILLEILFSKQKREIPNSNVILIDSELEYNKSLETSSIGNSEIIFLKEEIYERQIHLLSEYLNYGSMPRNAIFVWEIRKFQPIQTLLLLLRGLIYDIYEKKLPINNSKINRRVEIIENAFKKLNYLSEHTTKLCKQRWKMLKSLKELTWETIDTNKERNYTPSISSEILTVSKTLVQADMINDDNLMDEKDWDLMYSELTDIQSIIDENINLKVWDDASGHFV